jgi:DNA polymerase-1
MSTTDFNRYGWKCNETNLNTLPSSAPEEIKGLAKWLTLEGRRSSLAEWIGQVEEDGRIHGSFWPIGAWTHRMSHSSPNQANIPSVFTGTPDTPVKEVKYKYDSKLRELFYTDHYLVGCDAEGIQLRILAHYMKSPEYRDAIVKGNKDDGTDIHSFNKGLLSARTRGMAKTFIYAWVLGAGLPKVADILETNIASAKIAENTFISELPGLKKLKTVKIPDDAAKGFFVGLDGRRVPCNSEHLMLAGYLQNGEALCMKYATMLWTEWATKEGINYNLLNLVHDEWQTEVIGTLDDAKRLGDLQCKALEQVGVDFDLFCPLAGDYKIGRNWRETH